jgi:ubiquinone biosynthesis monooxygenase Coq6
MYMYLSGSQTALHPYSRERYLENHKVLSVTDKLHKLYGSTLTPVVWARSVGLEVLNELSLVKGALMFSAGAQRREKVRGDAAAWDFAASAAQTFSGGSNLAKLLTGSLFDMATSTVSNAVKMVRKR